MVPSRSSKTLNIFFSRKEKINPEKIEFSAYFDYTGYPYGKNYPKLFGESLFKTIKNYSNYSPMLNWRTIGRNY